MINFKKPAVFFLFLLLGYLISFQAYPQASLPDLEKEIIGGETPEEPDIDTELFDTIAKRITDDQEGTAETGALEDRIDAFLPLYNSSNNGSFTDLNYAGTSASVWSGATGPSTHLNRLRDMAMAYVRAESKYFEDDDLYETIVNAANYWFTRNPTSSNWWHATIGNPQKMGVFLLVMRKGAKQLPKTTEDNLIYRMEYGPSRQAEDAVNEGANRSDIALHYLYRACLTYDHDLMARGFLNGFEPIKMAYSGEGIKIDYSYLMHGMQLQITSYGNEFMNTSVSFGMYAVGTEFAMPASKVEILSNYARKAYFNVFRGPYVHYNSMGRSVSRPNSIQKPHAARFAEAMMVLDPTHADEYEMILKRIQKKEPAGHGVETGNTSYFVGDYAVHTRPGYTFAVRTVSNRTVRSESINGEALQSYFVSDGSTSLMQDGDEYYNIPVGWNWTRLPGITAPQYPFESVPRSNSYLKRGESNFVGGVSDTRYSANTFYLTDTFTDNVSGTPTPKHPVNTRGHKSWFFFDDEVVCLGAGINSTNVYPVNTAVEQNLLKSDVVVSAGGSEETLNRSYRGEKSYENNLDWVLHNGAGYFFPDGGKLHVENKTQVRAWYNINQAHSKDPVSTDIFTLWFDHGIAPTDASYAYVVVPGMETASDMRSYDMSSIEIISNTPEVQAVWNKKSNILQVIFSKAGKFEHDGMSITTDAGAAMIFKNIGSEEVTMHVADPGRHGMPITVQTLIPSVAEKRKEITCDFSAASGHAGETRVYTINSGTPDAEGAEFDREPDFEYSSVVLADAFVTERAKGTAHGTAPDLEIKLNDVPGWHRQSYVKFSLADLDNWDDQENYEAQVFVQFYVINANTDIKSTRWVIAPVEDIAWEENAITWNNRPPVSGDVIAAARAFPPVTDGALDVDENRVRFDITQYALDEYAKGNEVISLNINNDIPGPKVDSRFASKEHENPGVHPLIVVRLYKTGEVEEEEEEDEEVSVASVSIDGNETSSTGEFSYSYVVPREHGDRSTIQVTVNLEGGNEVVGDNPFTVEVGKASVQDATFEVKNGDKTRAYTLRVEKRFSFDDIVSVKWGHMYVVNNNSVTNGGFTFTGYRWFKDGGVTPASTKQYYRESEAGTSTLRVEMTTGAGVQLQTWPKEVESAPFSVSAYPNPVNAGGTVYLNVEGMPGDFFRNASFSVYGVSGVAVKSGRSVKSEVTPVRMPTSPGIYILRVTDGIIGESVKIIVK